jgi:hypothetical protein
MPVNRNLNLPPKINDTRQDFGVLGVQFAALIVLRAQVSLVHPLNYSRKPQIMAITTAGKAISPPKDLSRGRTLMTKLSILSTTGRFPAYPGWG